MRFASAIAFLLVLGLAAQAVGAEAAAISGFSRQGAEAEASVESQYRGLTSTVEISKFHRYLTSEPHPAGSARNNHLAQWIAQQWRDQGLEDVTIHEYDVLNSSPKEISVEMVHPVKYRATLREDP